jgi:hypothetical protein
VPHRVGVERARHHGWLAQDGHALDHVGGLVSEGHEQDAGCEDGTSLDRIGRAAAHDACLAGSGEDDQWASGGLDRHALSGVQVVNQAGSWSCLRVLHCPCRGDAVAVRAVSATP